MANSRVDRNGSADRNTDEDNPAGNTECVHEGHEIIRHRVDAERPADLLRQSGATRVIAQDLPLPGEVKSDKIPALERSAHLMDQNQRRDAAPRQLVAERSAVDLDEIHGALSPEARSPGSPAACSPVQRSAALPS